MTWAAEGAVHALDQELEVAAGEVAVGVFFLELGGGRLGEVVAVLLEGEEAFGQACQCIEHAEVFVGVILELFFAGAGGEIAEILGDLGEGHL